MHRVTRWASGLAAALVLVTATAGAWAWHTHLAAGQPTSLHDQGQRLRDIRTILSGSDLAPNRGTCAWFMRIDRARDGASYPRVGSADWNRVLAICSDGGS